MSKTKGFERQWFYVEMPEMDLPHSVLVNDPLRGECIAAFKDPFDALFYIKDLEIEQLEKEYKYLLSQHKNRSKNEKA